MSYQKPKQSKGSKAVLSWTTEHLDNLVATGKIRGYKVMSMPRMPKEVKEAIADKKKAEPGAQKHGNTACVYDGIRFDSTKERRRYIDLKFLEQQGIITELKLQVPYELNEDGTFSYQYIADFVYKDATGKEVVEDSKGYRTREYRKKRKLMKKIHDITIKET